MTITQKKFFLSVVQYLFFANNCKNEVIRDLLLDFPISENSIIRSRFFWKSRIYVTKSDDQLKNLVYKVFQFYSISRLNVAFVADIKIA